ncbi:MAG: TIGR03790 family protein [Desulfatiglandaceae bacterium]
MANRTISMLFWQQLFGLFFFIAPALALEADEILVIANKKEEQGVRLAHFYMQKRNIPTSNLLIIETTRNETCSRVQYEKEIRNPLRLFLKQHPALNRTIRCLVLMYGMPLKISSSDPNAGNRHTMGASVDSEIALARAEDYALEGWILNPFFYGFQKRKLPIKKDAVFMVGRIDGASAAIAKRIVTDSIQAEKAGLSGMAFFDARWPLPESKPSQENGYAFYDYAIHHAAQIIEKTNRIPVVIDERSELFKTGSGLRAGLYCGWYSVARYVDAFEWQKGSVGYHIASHECTTLKKPESRVWCKEMLEKGVAATIGPVAEPYVEAFPLPDIFFSFLVDGYLSLSECYFLSTPFLSWQMVLVGDPLYRPFYTKRRMTSSK